MIAENLEVLETVYEMTSGNENNPVGEQLVGEQLGQQLDETKRIVNWLVSEGFLKRGSIANVQLTHKGIKEIEKGILPGK